MEDSDSSSLHRRLQGLPICSPQEMDQQTANGYITDQDTLLRNKTIMFPRQTLFPEICPADLR